MRVVDVTSHANLKNIDRGRIDCSLGWGDLISYVNPEISFHSSMANCYGQVGDCVFCFIKYMNLTDHKT